MVRARKVQLRDDGSWITIAKRAAGGSGRGGDGSARAATAVLPGARLPHWSCGKKDCGEAESLASRLLCRTCNGPAPTRIAIAARAAAAALAKAPARSARAPAPARAAASGPTPLERKLQAEVAALKAAAAATSAVPAAAAARAGEAAPAEAAAAAHGDPVPSQDQVADLAAKHAVALVRCDKDAAHPIVVQAAAKPEEARRRIREAKPPSTQLKAAR